MFWSKCSAGIRGNEIPAQWVLVGGGSVLELGAVRRSIRVTAGVHEEGKSRGFSRGGNLAVFIVAEANIKA